MNHYEAKKQARIDRYKELSKKSTEKSQFLMQQSHDMVSGIPVGQPILVGHHSEKAHRNLLDRSWNKLGQSVQEGEKADYYAQKAAIAESNTAISSDDPEALDKLREAVEAAEFWHEKMKGMNAYYRKHKTCKGFEGISDETAAEYDLRVERGYSWEKQPFPSYKLTNSNANIRRIKDRIKELTRLQENPITGWEFEGGRVEANQEENRLQMFFDERLSKEMYDYIAKRCAFKWSRKNQCFQRQLNRNSVYAAKSVIEEFLKNSAA